LLTRDGGSFSLAQALARCSLEPARLLQDRAPAMHRKGRLQIGSDADIVVFDPATMPTRPATAAAPGPRPVSGTSWSTARSSSGTPTS